MTREQQSPLEASAIKWPGLRNHILCMAYSMDKTFGPFMSSISVNGRTKVREALERNQRFREIETADIRKSQRLRNEGNGRNNMVSGMRPGLT
jgi:hypothetical protein